MNELKLLIFIFFVSDCSPLSSHFLQPMDKKYNPVIAHRGAWKAKDFPQNSIASLRNAIDLKCQGSEFDVRMTRDGMLVINHDEKYQGMDIETHDLNELLNIPLPNGEKLPQLSEYLKAGKKDNGHTRLILEIKPSTIGIEKGKLIAEKVYDIVQKIKMEKQITFISFDIAILKKLVSLDKNLSTQYLHGDLSPKEIKSLNISGIDYHFSVFKTGHPEWITEAKELKLQLNAWTVNSKEDLQFFIDNHFDQITTNEPELLFNILSQR
ncbi:MAG: glycerophosphodiester phosphodiesterase family protein [Saprospiraceae bacterium]